MPWFKVDDKFHSHPKVMELPASAVGIWTLAGTWCADYLTDGAIRLGQLRRLGGTQEDADALVAAGLWESTEDGYAFRDWSDYQPMKSAVEQEREASRERQRLARERREEKRREEQANKKRTSDDVTPASQRDNNVTHTPVTEKFSSPVPEPEPVPGTSKEVPEPLSNADAIGPEGKTFELIAEEIQGRTEEQAFDEFWTEYPRKEGKKAARQKFAVAIRHTKAQIIIDGAARLAADPNRETAFTPHAKTWLHNDGWTDPPLPPRQPNGGRQTAAQRKMQTAQERHQRLTGRDGTQAPWTLKQLEED